MKKNNSIIQIIMMLIAETFWLCIPQFKQKMLKRIFYGYTSSMYTYTERFSPIKLFFENKYYQGVYTVIFLILIALTVLGITLTAKGKYTVLKKFSSYSPFLSCVIVDLLVMSGSIDLVADGVLRLSTGAYITGIITLVLCLVGNIINKED